MSSLVWQIFDFSVIPAEAGIQHLRFEFWIPASAGMTNNRNIKGYNDWIRKSAKLKLNKEDCHGEK